MIRISGEATIGKGRGGHIRLGPFTYPALTGTGTAFQTVVHNLNTKIVSVFLNFYSGNVQHDSWWSSGTYPHTYRGYKWGIIDNNTIELTLFQPSIGGTTTDYYVDVYSREDFF